MKQIVLMQLHIVRGGRTIESLWLDRVEKATIEKALNGKEF